MNWKRSLAMIALLGNILCFVALLVFSFLDFPQVKQYLMATMYVCIALPVIVYAFLLLVKVLKAK